MIIIKNIIKLKKESKENEYDKYFEYDLLENILETKKKLEEANKNFEFAQKDLVEYYSYEIKANTAKLNYLIKFAKHIKVEMSTNNRQILRYEKGFNKKVI